MHCCSMIIFIITITSVQRPGHRPTAVVKMSKLDWNESEHQKRLKPRASIHQAKLDPIFMLFGDSNCTPAALELQRRELKWTSRFVYSLNMECTRVVTYHFFRFGCIFHATHRSKRDISKVKCSRTAQTDPHTRFRKWKGLDALFAVNHFQFFLFLSVFVFINLSHTGKSNIFSQIKTVVFLTGGFESEHFS